MTAYYNEIDPQAAAWLRELIKQNLIAPGVVDKRSIEDVRPAELLQYTQCHFFAGIGVWSYALRQAGWPDDRPVWTGSCPCQPFSAAGKGDGFADERHLWPAFDWLIGQCKPVTVFGEQVAGKAGETWLDLVSTDLENKGYTCGSVVTAACGFGAPHQRKRLYWVADNQSERLGKARDQYLIRQEERVGFGSDISCMADNQSNRRNERDSDERGSVCRIESQKERSRSECDEQVSFMADTISDRSQGWIPRWADSEWEDINRQARCDSADRNPGPTNGFWRDVDWLACRDDKWRPVEPGTFPLADGAAARVGRLRGYGNAIVAQQAQAFIEAYCEN